MILFIVLSVIYMWVFFGKRSLKIFILLIFISCSSADQLLMPKGTVIMKSDYGVFVSFPAKNSKDMGAAWFDIEANEGDTLEIIKK